MSKIEWTEKTWNPVVGCSVESPGCKNCYAMGMAGRIEAMHEKSGKGAAHYAGTTQKIKGKNKRRGGSASDQPGHKSVWTGKVASAPDATWSEPLKRKKPTLYFVNSMGDLFHPNVPDAWIDRAFAVMALSPQHTFQVLTKHPKRMREHLEFYQTDEWADLHYSAMMNTAVDWESLSAQQGDEMVRLLHSGDADSLACKGDLWPNVWLGTSVEDQKRADLRLPDLLATPAAVRFVSVEPLLGLVDIKPYLGRRFECRECGLDDKEYGTGLTATQKYCGICAGDNGRDVRLKLMDRGLDWVIVGGESGPGARPMHPDWVRSVRDQCAKFDVPFFFKQWGAWAEAVLFHDKKVSPQAVFMTPDGRSESVDVAPSQGLDLWDEAGVTVLDKVGKAKAGRTLDGQVHDGIPDKRRGTSVESDGEHKSGGV